LYDSYLVDRIISLAFISGSLGELSMFYLAFDSYHAMLMIYGFYLVISDYSWPCSRLRLMITIKIYLVLFEIIRCRLRLF